MWSVFHKPLSICFVDDEVNDSDVPVQLGGAAHLVSPVGPLEAEADPLKRLVDAFANPFAVHQNTQQS